MLAYALVLQDGLIASDGASDGNDHTLADAFAAPASEQPLGAYRAFIQVDHDFLMSELIESPPALVVLKLGASVSPTDDGSTAAANCAPKDSRSPFSATVDLCDAIQPLDLAEIIAIDLATANAATLVARIGRLRTGGKKLLAQNVETAAQLWNVARRSEQYVTDEVRDGKA